MSIQMDSTSLVLFQYGAVHEEIAPAFLTACNTLNQRINISLHNGSLRNKGNVFDAFGKESLEGHQIIYRPSRPSDAKPDDQLEDLVETLDKACVIFLTLQNPWTIDIAERLQSKGVLVTGIIHNIDKACRDRSVLSFWKKTSNIPIVLSSHVQCSLATRLQRPTDSIRVLHSTFTPQTPLDQPEYPLNNRILIAISGGINYGTRPFRQLIEALVKLKRQCPLISSQLKFVLLGGGVDRDRLFSEVQQSGLSDSFHFSKVSTETGRSSYGEYYNLLSTCHYILILDHKAYTSLKITSAVPTSISFLKPVIASKEFLTTYQLDGAGIEADDLQSAFCNIISKKEWLAQVQCLREIRAKQLQSNIQLVKRLLR